MRLSPVLVLISLSFAGAAQQAQQPAPVPGRVAAPAPVRDSSQVTPPPTVSGRLSGRVLIAGTEKPLYRALVQLMLGSAVTSRWTLTDREGGWVFSEVPAGSYTIRALRDGYVASGFGQGSAYGTPTPIVLNERGTRENLNIALARGGVIAGRITDDAGEGVSGVVVQAMRVRFVDGVRELVEVRASPQLTFSGAITDDLGEYRLHSLAPGSYYVSATYGQINLGRTDDTTTYATTYAPGTELIAQAAAIAVQADKPATADMSLVRTRLANVSGRVLTSAGVPSRGTVALGPVAPGYAIQTSFYHRLTSPVAADGSFLIRGVPVGTYYLVGGPSPPSPRGGGPAEPATTFYESAHAEVTVSGVDIENLVVQTEPTGNLAGRLKVDSAQQTGVEGFYVRIRSIGPGAFGDLLNVRTDATGAFAIPRVRGQLLVRLDESYLKPGWWLKSVTINGVDVTDTGHDFQGGRTTFVEVVVTDRIASLTGSVRNAAGQPVSDYSVVAFAQDNAKWTPFTRFVRSAGGSQDGTFKIDGLPAGDYFIVAVPPIEAGEETDPDKLAKWRDGGQAVMIGDGERKTVVVGFRP